jgi:hypothetical protein
MNWRQKNQIERVQGSQYASREDFCRLFTGKMDSLYWLAFLLTADHKKAQQCFVAGLEDCVQAKPVFQSCANSWAKKTIVQNAIRTLKPRPGAAGAGHAPIRRGVSQFTGDFHFGRVLALEDFERFVFVMSVLERYSDPECAFLLDCLVQDIQVARSQALQQISDSPSAPSLPSLHHSCA